MIPDPVPALCPPWTERVTTLGPAVAAMAVVRLTSASSLMVNAFEPASLLETLDFVAFVTQSVAPAPDAPPMRAPTASMRDHARERAVGLLRPRCRWRRDAGVLPGRLLGVRGRTVGTVLLTGLRLDRGLLTGGLLVGGVRVRLLLTGEGCGRLLRRLLVRRALLGRAVAAASADRRAVRPVASRSGAGSTLLRSTAVPRSREARCRPPAQRVRTAARSHRSGWTGGVRRAAVRLRCRSWRFCSFQAQSASRAELSVSFAPAVRRLGLRRKDLRTVS